MNPGNSEPRQVASESPLQSSRRANKRRRHDQNGGGGEQDGQKYPPTREAIVSFECPFCKHDPHRYAECRGYQLSRLSDVLQHISRQHRLVEVNIKPNGTVREDDIVLYCPFCRHLFRGMGAAHRLRVHSTAGNQCQITNIEESGVMLDGEVEALKSELGSCKGKSERERWFIIWKRLFPGQQPPLSPYVEICVSRLQMESILHDELESIQGFPPEGSQSIVRRWVDRIYKPSPQPHIGPFVPPQAQSSKLPTTPVPTYSSTPHMHSDTELASHTLQPQTQGFDYSSDPTYLGVQGTPTGVQRENSFNWNNTLTNYSAPSPIPGSGAHPNSGSNFASSEYFTVPGSGYPPVPYVGYPTGSFESVNQDNGYLNTRRNTTGHRGSHY
ncbi:uncharacterized protein FPRO_00125 [Fusarium proliferatum ET1]|uniref:C2H2-type domain-containing protein n=1 Tax=Fusarium proliferatum (strain ET1) TaxID=1227346 RepID=A0A1L7V6F5_FUSPR|nr:uncharacterized protein FPRO_00125 [Fusarium proliferatum ET1]CZR35752.1 uncharacterized protein FPRO_00125 [Fusarium proliferatum ET1]